MSQIFYEKVIMRESDGELLIAQKFFGHLIIWESFGTEMRMIFAAQFQERIGLGLTIHGFEDLGDL